MIICIFWSFRAVNCKAEVFQPRWAESLYIPDGWSSDSSGIQRHSHLPDTLPLFSCYAETPSLAQLPLLTSAEVFSAGPSGAADTCSVPVEPPPPPLAPWPPG